jgi:hypothetical protein
MAWTVVLHAQFDAEFQALDESLQDELLAHAKLLQEFGPNLDRGRAIRRTFSST